MKVNKLIYTLNHTRVRVHIRQYMNKLSCSFVFQFSMFLMKIQPDDNV